MSGTIPGYPWSEGDALFASALNDAIANNISGPFLPLSGGSIGTISGNPPPVNSLTASGKLWLGAATARTGNLTWVGTNHSNMAYFDTLSQFQSVVPLTGANTNGIAGAFSVRSSDVNISNSRSFGGIGVGSFVVNDYVPTGASPDRIRSMWNAYFHSERKPNTGPLLGIEMEIANQGDTVTINSYLLPNPAGITASLWLGSGGETNDGAGAGTCNPLSAQIVFINGGAVGGGAEKGIVFANSSLVRDATTQVATAIQMAASQQIEWLFGGGVGQIGSFIRGASGGSSYGIIFSIADGFAVVDAATEVPRFTIGNGVARFGVNGANNTLSITPGATSGANMTLRTEGTGSLQLVTSAALNITNPAVGGNAVTITPATTAAGTIGLAQSGTGGITTPLPMFLGNTSGPQIRTGTGAPSLSGIATGSIFVRTDGAAGARVYVYQGSAVWTPIAGV